MQKYARMCDIEPDSSRMMQDVYSAGIVDTVHRFVDTDLKALESAAIVIDGYSKPNGGKAIGMVVRAINTAFEIVQHFTDLFHTDQKQTGIPILRRSISSISFYFSDIAAIECRHVNE